MHTRGITPHYEPTGDGSRHSRPTLAKPNPHPAHGAWTDAQHLWGRRFQLTRRAPMSGNSGQYRRRHLRAFISSPRMLHDATQSQRCVYEGVRRRLYISLYFATALGPASPHTRCNETACTRTRTLTLCPPSRTTAVLELVNRLKKVVSRSRARAGAMTTALPVDDLLDDLATIDLSDEFIDANATIDFNEGYSKQTQLEVCESFVRTFLVEQAANVTTLYAALNDCSAVLEGVEAVLEGFAAQLNAIQADMGDVRECLASTTAQLANRRAAEKILWAAVSRMVVPPEVVQVLTCSNEVQLGGQFKMCVCELLKYLNYRRGSLVNHAAGRSGPTDGESVALREVRFALSDCRAHAYLMAVLDGVTVFACMKIKSFLSKTLLVLTKKDTNVAIQQENVLAPFAFYVHFLRAAIPLLRHTLSSSSSTSQQQGGASEPRMATLVPFRIARSLYAEFRAEYCTIMALLYLEKVQEYAMTCNSMEYPTAAVTSRGGSFLGSVGVAAAAGSPTCAYRIPLITDPSPSAWERMKLGGRGAIFEHVFEPPLIPTIERVHKRRHTYEETIRSILSLVCDIVTHEYLFTYAFFSGDVTVYAEVLKPTIQFIVDYVSEVVLVNASGGVQRMLNERPRTALNNASEDTYGLLILIRLCLDYRAMMQHKRKLSCLDGFFDSVLNLLWPVFKKGLERQLIALRCTPPASLAAQLGNAARAVTSEEKLRAVHPLVKSFAQFSSVIHGIVGGAILTEERLMDESVLCPVSGKGSEVNLLDPSSSVALEDVPEVTPAWSRDVRLNALKHILLAELEGSDSKGELTALLGTLSFMRVEVFHALDGVAAQIVADEGNAALRRRLSGQTSCFALNSAYEMLHTMRTSPILFEGNTLTLDQRADMTDIDDAYSRFRTDFAARLLETYFPHFIRVVREADSCTPEEIMQAADQFVLHWRGALDAMRDAVHRLIADPANEQDIVGHACMDFLLHNTRFHAAVAKRMETNPDVFGCRPLRTMIVTNQLLLQHMRQFSSAVSDGQR